MKSPFGYGGTSHVSPFASGSGHEAGYVWAQTKGITDESEAPSREGSFREGALAYVASLKDKSGDETNPADAWG